MPPEPTSEQARFITDDEIARRLGQLRMRLLTAQAEIPGMVREVEDLIRQLERD